MEEAYPDGEASNTSPDTLKACQLIKESLSLELKFQLLGWHQNFIRMKESQVTSC